MGRSRRIVASLVVLLGMLGARHASSEPSRAAPQDRAGRPAASPSADAGGFRLEVQPRIANVFGDAAEFKVTVDSFYAVHDQMEITRTEFAAHARNVLVALRTQGQNGRRTCPAEAIAFPYLRATQLGQKYHELGRELEVHHARIKELDSLGETQSLTPDYRWKVARALKLYRAILIDFKEMQATFLGQMAGELAHYRCDQKGLIAQASALVAQSQPSAPVVEVVQPVKPTKRRGKVEPEPEVISSSPATFFVDNVTCDKPLTVYVDSNLMGEVPARTKSAFRTGVGRHSMCLVPVGSNQRCGDPGTLRRSYIHDGWSITLRCD